MRFGLLLVTAAVMLTGSAAKAQKVTFEGGTGLASGNYIFEQTTTSYWLSAGLAVESGPVTVRGSIPIWIQNSTVISGLEMGPTPTGGSSSGTVADSGEARKGRGMGSGRGSSVAVPSSSFTDFQAGLGDPLVGASLMLSQGSRTSVSLTASLKVPLADTTNFGTGEWDLGLAGYLGHLLSSNWALGLSAGYWSLGDMPGLVFADVFRVGLVGSYLTRDGWALSLSGTGGNAAVGGYDPPVTVGGSVAKVTPGNSLGLSLDIGLSESVPDVMLGLVWTTRL